MLDSYIRNEYNIDPVYGGGFSLVMLGLLNRTVHDIDIFTRDIGNFTGSLIKRKNFIHTFDQYFDDKLRLDIFVINKGYYFKYFIHEINGVEYKFVDPLETYYSKIHGYGYKDNDLDGLMNFEKLNITELYDFV